MFYIVEEDSQLQLLQNIREKKCYIELITSNHNYHPKLSFISLIYIRIIDQDKGYIIPILHDEGMNVDLTRIQSLINSIDEVRFIDLFKITVLVSYPKAFHKIEYSYI